MACFHPLSAYRSTEKRTNGKSEIVFKTPARSHLYTSIMLPCGQCTGCRLERSRQWAIRCNHEASLHEENTFLTLTYDEEHLPPDGSINVEHFQKFMKRYRKHIAPKKIRFFHCGEYGEKLLRPHYHAIIFGHDFPDKEYHKKSRSGEIIYISNTLDNLWKKGHCYIGTVTFESSAYVARYILKKVNGDQKQEHYEAIDEVTGEVYQKHPEYTTMSRRPGIGKKWYDKFKQDVYPSDEVIIKKGKKNIAIPPPKYYDGLYEQENPVYHAHMKKTREQRAKDNAENNTPERLAVRETIVNSRVNKQLPRPLHNEN
jgi:hypothetical protein